MGDGRRAKGEERKRKKKEVALAGGPCGEERRVMGEGRGAKKKEKRNEAALADGPPEIEDSRSKRSAGTRQGKFAV